MMQPGDRTSHVESIPFINILVSSSNPWPRIIRSDLPSLFTTFGVIEAILNCWFFCSAGLRAMNPVDRHESALRPFKPVSATIPDNITTKPPPTPRSHVVMANPRTVRFGIT